MLRRRGKRPYRRKRRSGHNGDAAPHIDQRPEVIEERLRLGDFEGDTVLGPVGTGGLATLVRSQVGGLRSSSRFNPRTPTFMCMRKSNSV